MDNNKNCYGFFEFLLLLNKKKKTIKKHSINSSWLPHNRWFCWRGSLVDKASGKGCIFLSSFVHTAVFPCCIWKVLISKVLNSFTTAVNQHFQNQFPAKSFLDTTNLCGIKTWCLLNDILLRLKWFLIKLHNTLQLSISYI